MTTSSDIQQRSLEWFLEKAGKISPSNIPKMMDRTMKGLPTADATGFKWNLVTERLTGQPTNTFFNDAMRHGVDSEPIAKAFFSALYDIEVEDVGLLHHPTLDFIVCSPDGLLGTDEMLEIKCLTSKNHIEVLLNNAPQKDHVIQCQAQLWIAERSVNRLMYFDPRLPAEYQHKVFYLERDEELIKKIEEEAIKLDLEVQSILNQLKETI
jgi:putative phage-type endonuclease